MESTPAERSGPPRTPSGQGNRTPRSNRNSHPQAYSSPRPQRTHRNGFSGWNKWSQVRVLLDGLPADVEAKHLIEWFSTEGTLVSATVFESQQSKGKVVFAPPPEVPFWQSGIKVVHHPDFEMEYPAGIAIRMNLSQEPEQNTSQFMKIRAKSLDFGTMVGERSMKSIKQIKSGTFHSHDLRVEFNSRSKRLEVFFSIPGKDSSWRGLREYKIYLQTSQMKDVFCDLLSDKTCCLTFSMSLPPQYFWFSQDLQAHMESGIKNWTHFDSWSRATDVAEDIQAPLRYPVALSNDVADKEFLEIGRLPTFRIVLGHEADHRGESLIEQLLLALEDSNVVLNYDEVEVISGGPENMWSYLDHHHNSSLSKTAASELLQFRETHIYLPFEVRYQLEVCVSRGILSEYTVTLEFLTQLAAMSSTKARQLLEYAMDHGEPLILNPMDLFHSQDAAGYYPNLNLPHYCALVRKAAITPTTVRFNSPIAETSNRILRVYNHLQDRFLRVQFIEESEKSRIGMYRSQNDAIYNRIMRALYQGIQIGDRHYELLAFGNSQLRECGAYFFCPTSHTSCDEMRARMGQFDHIKVVAKYAARLGQCLSTTREIRGITAPQITKIADVEKNGYCFSDGVGKMSSIVATVVVEEMALDVFEEPSAFQFRMGGCKGLLTVCPEINGVNVQIRDSQKKFESTYNKLEIIRCAKPATATLNRQTITILEYLGVPKEIFLSLLDRQLQRFEAAMVNTNDAIDMLTQHVDENQTTLIIAELLRANFKNGTTREPFVTTVLDLWRSWSLKLLKEKARVEVEQSAFVLGCMDETGSLRGHDSTTEGSEEKDVNKLPQIFLQLSDPRIHRKTTIVEGVCIVGRNPSLHPGDIRVVEAVNKPELHHLKDLVVFPRGGDRPVPNMLSGGDLDGDDFFVIWDKDMIPSKWNHPPMNYAGVKAKEAEGGVTVDDLRDFFVSYMKSDVLGLVATSHLALADKHEEGPNSDICLELASLHSQAVDFPKTGVPVIWNPRFQPKGFPHFMEKKKGTYQSKKTLGVIYDKVSRQSVEFTPSWANGFDERVTKRFELSQEMLQTVAEIKKEYDVSMRRLLAQNNIKTEFELWTGFSMSKPAVGSDYKMQEVLGKEYESLKQRFREICFSKAGGTDPEKIDPFVAAMYKVTEDQVKTALSLPNESADSSEEPHAQSMPCISFPWIFHWIMIRIALGGNYGLKESVLAASKRKRECQNNPNTYDNEGYDVAKTAVEHTEQQSDEMNKKKPPAVGFALEDSSRNSGLGSTNLAQVGLFSSVTPTSLPPSSSTPSAPSSSSSSSSPSSPSSPSLDNGEVVNAELDMSRLQISQGAATSNAGLLIDIPKTVQVTQPAEDEQRAVELASEEKLKIQTPAPRVGATVIGGVGNFATETRDRTVVQTVQDQGNLVDRNDESDEESAEDRLLKMCS